MKLNKIANIINGSTPSTANPKFWDGNISRITPKDMALLKNRYISYGSRNITKLGYDSCSTTLVPKGTVLLTSRAPIGYVAIASNQLCTNQGFKSIICNDRFIKPLYLYYWILKNKDYLESIAGGSTFKELSKEQLGNVDVELPNLEIQQHIVNTIGSIDNLVEKYLVILDSIKLYRTLIYKYFSLNSSNEVPFKETVIFENGAQPPKSEHIYEEKDGYIRFIQNRDYDSDNHKTFIPVSKKNHLCNKYDILIDKYGDAGAVRYGLEGAYNVALLKIIPNNELTKEYIRDFLIQDEIKNILYNSSQASTRPSLNEDTFLGLNIPLLDVNEMKLYEKIASPLLNLELNYKEQIAKLKFVKEKLLSKYF